MERRKTQKPENHKLVHTLFLMSTYSVVLDSIRCSWYSWLASWFVFRGTNLTCTSFLSALRGLSRVHRVSLEPKLSFRP